VRFTKQDLDFAFAKIQRQRAAKSVATRMQWSKEQRAAQARKAALSRKDRAKAAPWFGLVLYPQDYVWRGVKDALRVLDEMENTPPVFWSQDETEVKAAQREWFDKGRIGEILEQPYNPGGKLQIEWAYEPDPKRAAQALREAIR
jgi:hypothetical protein